MIRKNIDLIPCVCLCYCERVVPHVGAWIETLSLQSLIISSTSSPMLGRGLKHADSADGQDAALVAPYVGAWIETTLRN